MQNVHTDEENCIDFVSFAARRCTIVMWGNVLHSLDRSGCVVCIVQHCYLVIPTTEVNG